MAALRLLLCCFCWQLGAAVDTITSSQYIKDPEAVVSAGNKFKLGFFSPGNSTNRYVGIWYSNISVTTPVWIANRNKPLNDSSGIMTISEDGNIVVLDGRKEILWSSNVSNGVSNSSAQLTDDGNVILRGGEIGNSLWQSFQEPSDTFMLKMRLTANRRTGKKTQITSWKSPSDPSVGSFSSGIEPSSIPEVFVWNDSRPFWRSGPWNGQAFIGIPEMNSVYLNGYNLVQDGDGTFSLSVGLANESYITNFALSYEGRFGEMYWDSANERWEHKKQYPGDDCDIYGKCGPFGFCNTQNSLICRCLKGFEPKNSDEWNRRNWTNGCVRRRELKCERTQSDGQVPKEDEFLKLDKVKVPDFSEWSSSASEQNCKDECLNNCSCIAYSYHTGIGCMLWRGKLTDIRKFSSGGANLYVRLADLEFGKNRDMKAVISITVVTGAIIVAVGAFFWWRRMAKYRERKRESERILSSRRKKGYPIFFNGNLIQESMNQVKFQELPLFKLQMLIAATDYFDAANKLGEGGFGPVYRGNLPDGQEIAVKRLSRASGQGQEEFMNEVVVISELQHRNLVRLLGCCVEGDEKMLVYEYMPNKSLDASLFG